MYFYLSAAFRFEIHPAEPRVAVLDQLKWWLEQRLSPTQSPGMFDHAVSIDNAMDTDTSRKPADGGGR